MSPYRARHYFYLFFFPSCSVLPGFWFLISVSLLFLILFYYFLIFPILCLFSSLLNSASFFFFFFFFPLWVQLLDNKLL